MKPDVRIALFNWWSNNCEVNSIDAILTNEYGDNWCEFVDEYKTDYTTEEHVIYVLARTEYIQKQAEKTLHKYIRTFWPKATKRVYDGVTFDLETIYGEYFQYGNSSTDHCSIDFMFDFEQAGADLRAEWKRQEELVKQAVLEETEEIKIASEKRELAEYKRLKKKYE